MIDSKKLEQIARHVQESLPKGLRDLGGDIEKKIRQVLHNQLSRMDLISREKFDMQTQVLLRTQEKLNQLELRLNALETMPKNDSTISLSVSDDGRSGAKPTNISSMNENVTNIFDVEQVMLEEGKIENNKTVKDTIKKL